MEKIKELEEILNDLSIFDKKSPDFSEIFDIYEDMKYKYLEYFWKNKISDSDLQNFENYYKNILEKSTIFSENKLKLEKIFENHLEKLKLEKQKRIKNIIANFCIWFWSILNFKK